MEINLKDTLYELRKEKKVTQEAVAEHLGITSQSVGKWERGEGFPDITLLHALALYFGVTVDELLGVGEARKEERIDALLDEAERCLREKGPAEAVEVCRAAHREFPNDMRVMARFMRYVHFNDAASHEEDTRLAISFGEQILSKSVDHRQRTGVVETLAYLYKEHGEPEKAKEYASMLGNVYQTSDQVLGVILSGDERAKARQKIVLTAAGLLANNILYLYCFGGEMPDDDICCAEKTLALLDLIFEDGDYGLDMPTVYEAHFDLAQAYGRKRNADRCLEELEIAADFAFRIEETQKHEIRYTSRLVCGLSYPPEATNGYPAVAIMADEMEEFGCFDFLREDERFKAIQKRLSAHLAQNGTRKAGTLQ